MGRLHNSGAYPTNSNDHAMLRGYQAKCLEVSRRNPYENRVAQWLKKTGLKWGRQKCLGWRIADFWNKPLGVIVEVDGSDHSAVADSAADAIHAARSAILVFRVKNKASESELKELLDKISKVVPWNDRRELAGLRRI